MLGLADRGRVLDLFEKLMGGEIAAALAEFKSLYDNGADPLVVMQDLLETTHFLTRVKVAPGAEGFFDGGSAEAARAVTMAGKLTVPALTRAWQMLLKGLIEVRDAAKSVSGGRDGAGAPCPCRGPAADRAPGAQSARCGIRQIPRPLRCRRAGRGAARSRARK